MNEISNAQMEQVIIAITSYCDELEKGKSYGKKNKGADAVVETCHRLLPNVLSNFNKDQPSIILAKEIIGFSVRGINSELVTVIWADYLLSGQQVEDIAKKINYTNRSVYRLLRMFPQKVAEYLWLLNQPSISASNAPFLQHQTLPQKQTDFLKITYKLTLREAEILLIYCEPSKLKGRKEIARILHISDNTLKSHHHSICHKVGATTMNDAAQKANSAMAMTFGLRSAKGVFSAED